MVKRRLVALVFLLLLTAPALACPADPPSPPGPARQPPASGEWVISTAETYSSQTLQLNGNLTIRSGGNLTLVSVKLSISPSFEGEFHIEVQSGGALIIQDKDLSPFSPDDASVLSSSSSFQYLLWVRSGGSLRILNSVIRNCGYKMGLRGETAGVYLQSSDCAISNTTFTDCYCGVAVDNCAPSIQYSAFTKNRWHGMYVRDSTIVLENNLFDGNAQHGLCLQASSPILRQNIFRGNLQDGLYAQSSPLVLEANTFQANSRRALTAEGAPVRSTRDALIQNMVGFHMTGSTLDCESPYVEENNYCFFLLDVRATVRNATMLRTGLYELYLGRSSDHTEFVSYNNSIRNVSFGDAESLLRVEWLVRPRVVWESSGLPVAGALVKFYRTATGELVFSYIANDTGELPPLMMTEYEQTRGGKVNTSSYRVGVFSGRFVESLKTSITSDMDLELLLDDVPPRFTLSGPKDNLTTPAPFCWVNGTMLTDLDASLTVNERPQEIDQSTGNFSTRVELSEGPNPINVTAVDPIFNVFTIIRNVNRDSTPPALTVDIPPEGLLLNRTYLLVVGSTEPRCYVLVNGVPALVQEDGSYEFQLQLSEGQNNLTVFSADQYKNGMWANRTIIVDTVPPEMAILSPGDGSWTNRPRTAVSGRTEDGATVLFNGYGVAVDRGNFSVTANLSEGQNLLVFQCRDRAGNQNSTTLRLRLDTALPNATFTYPANGIAVNFSSINITLTTEPGVTVTCRGANVSSGAGGNFSVLYALQPGENFVQIDLLDPAGNRGSAELRIVLDTTVSFSLSSPENGTRTTGASVKVLGRAEPGASVTIEGQNATVDQDGVFRATVRLRPGKNVLVINVTDAAGNRARFFLLVKHEEPTGPDPLLLAAILMVVVVIAAVGAGAFVRSRRQRAAAAAPPPPPGPTFVDNQRLVLKAAEKPRESLRCPSCLRPVDESWAQCHTCGGPTSLAEIAPSTRERLEAAAPSDERGRRLRAALLKGFSDAALLSEAGVPLGDGLRRLCIAAQLLLAGERPEPVEAMVTELEHELGTTAAQLAAGKKADLEKAQSEARERMTGILDEAERALPGLRQSGAETRELERAISLARLHLRAGSFEKAHQHTLDAQGLAGRLLGRRG